MTRGELQGQPSPLELRPTVMEVDLDALAHNFAQIRSHVAPAKVMAVVKANAYGHGLIPCAKQLVAVGADALGVALVEEGIALRRAGIDIPILVFGGIFGSQIRYFLDYDLEITASSVSKLEAIEWTAQALGKRAKVHLKVDTGMERIGIHYYTAHTLFEKALRVQYCDVVGVFSHFATADSADQSFLTTQLERFLKCLTFFTERSKPVPVRHIANSAAVLANPATHLDLVRAGVILYGVSPTTRLVGRLDLKPVMSLRSRVVFFKVVRAGAGVSYGHTWFAERDTRVVTVPIGYGDGYFRALSNRGSVLIRGKRYPIVGSVCMDQTMVDLGDGEAFNGDEVVLIGEQGSVSLSVNELADIVETTPHEVLTSTNLRVPRRYSSTSGVALHERE